MMGERRVRQDALFYEFSLERHVPERHLLRSIDRFVEVDGLRQELAPFYSEMGRPWIDPELLIRMLIVGYCFGIRSERRLCEEVHLNLRTAGFVDWASTVRYLIIRPFRRTGMAVSAIAICCAGCSKPCCNGASKRAWPAVKGFHRRQLDRGRGQRPHACRGHRGPATGRSRPRGRGISRRPRRCRVRRGDRND